MKGYRDNGGRSTTVYDDVFGGPPKFGATTLPPRLEDYTEIFQGFHVSRGTSIPVLDLPAPADDSGDVWFDARSSKLDYREVFGGFNGFDFALSYEQLIGGLKVSEDDSSDDAWTPAQSESLSDESDPNVSLEINQQASAAEVNERSGVKFQNEPKMEVEKDVLSGNKTQSSDVSVSSVLDNHALPSKIENENLFSLSNNDIAAKDFDGVLEGKQLRKSLSQPLQRYGSDPCHSVGNQKPFPVGTRQVLSVSDLGLKTQPSHLPPPSRPPPALTAKKGDTSHHDSKLKMSKSYAFERITGNQSPPYFDVEIDAGSSAAADAAAMRDAVAQAQAKLKSAKELMDRKKDGLQSRSKSNAGDKRGRVNECYERSIGAGPAGGERIKGLPERDSKHEVKEEKHNDTMDLDPNGYFTGLTKNNTTVESFYKEDCKVVQERELCGVEENNEGQETRDRFHREEHLKEPTISLKTCSLRETEKSSFVSQQHGDCKTPNDSDESELYENLIEIQLEDNDMETAGKIVVESWFKNDNGMEGDDIGPAFHVWEDYDVELEEVHENEQEKGLKESIMQDEELQQPVPLEISTIQSEEEEDLEREESKRIVKDPFELEESDNTSETISEQDENKKEQTLNDNENILQEKLMQEEVKIKAEEALMREETIRDDNVQTINHTHANVEAETVHKVYCNTEEKKELLIEHEREDSEKREEAVSETSGIEDGHEGVKWDDDYTRLNLIEENESITRENSEASDVVFQMHDNEIVQDVADLKQDISCERNETIVETPCSVKVDECTQILGEESVSSYSLSSNDLQDVKVEVRTEEVTCSDSLNESSGKALTENHKKTSEVVSGSKNSISFTSDHAGFHPEGITNTSTTKSHTDQVDSLRNSGRIMENKNEIRHNVVPENRGKEERLQRAREIENERLRKLEEERERQIEREKDRMAIDRATLEARESAFSETRERAERAAVERATAEFRQRALAEARERLEKACAEARERSLAEKAMEGRLRVEKATAEARERAERSVADKFSNYKNSGMRQNSLPADLAGSYSGFRYSQTVAESGGDGESPQRCKARLERHQRTADRAAKALAEKNMRDLVAQKEQAERSRLAESLDAEVKRWSSGKQGNLRALLSTLQYILGSDSGWQPIPLTEVITTAAVKKAYRKATLCVHPDKLQQRGATIQQKYICEKVFDLLKEAWNKFNSEER
uniref:auxilin-related protein 1-like n=1 Tax=Erigeron canadensis TaxID=72917 RepID=UPI001CB91141|nr:auxilin-related protein 1-like [Erigeron canadensis]